MPVGLAAEGLHEPNAGHHDSGGESGLRGVVALLDLRQGDDRCRRPGLAPAGLLRHRVPAPRPLLLRRPDRSARRRLLRAGRAHVRGAGAGHGPAVQPNPEPDRGVHGQRVRQRRRDRGLRPGVVPAHAAAGLVRAVAGNPTLLRQAAERAQALPPGRRVSRRAGALGHRARPQDVLVAVLQDSLRRADQGHHHQQHRPPGDGEDQRIRPRLRAAAPAQPRRGRRPVRGRLDNRGRLGQRRAGGPRPRREERRRGRDRSGAVRDREGGSPRPSVRRPARQNPSRRRPEFPAQDGEDLRPDSLRPRGLARAALGLLKPASGELPLHRRSAGGREGAAEARRRLRDVQLLPAGLGRRPARQDGRERVRFRTAGDLAAVPRGDSAFRQCAGELHVRDGGRRGFRPLEKYPQSLRGRPDFLAEREAGHERVGQRVRSATDGRFGR